MLMATQSLIDTASFIARDLVGISEILAEARTSRSLGGGTGFCGLGVGAASTDSL